MGKTIDRMLADVKHCDVCGKELKGTGVISTYPDGKNVFCTVKHADEYWEKFIYQLALPLDCINPCSNTGVANHKEPHLDGFDYGSEG